MQLNGPNDLGQPPDSEESKWWADLATRLLLQAHYILAGLWIRGYTIRSSERGAPAILGQSAEDFVQQVIQEAIRGGGGKSLDDSLRKELQIRLKQLMWRQARRKENNTSEAEPIEEMVAEGTAKVNELHSVVNTPSQAAAQSDTGRMVRNFVQCLDEELKQYAHCIMRGIEKPRLIAENMEIPIHHVNYLKKKLRTEFGKFCARRPEADGLWFEEGA